MTLTKGNRTYKRRIFGDLTKEQKASRASWREEHTWHPHQLRHNVATTLRKLHGLDAARTALGHSTLDATQIYADLDREKARTAIRGLTLRAS